MNFWIFEEDHSQGYYQPVSNKAARRHGGQLVRGMASLVVYILKLVGSILWGAISLFLPFRPKAAKKYRR